MKLIFYPFDAIRESSKPSSQLTGKARAFFVNVNKQCQQLLVKIENNPFINKQPGVHNKNRRVLRRRALPLALSLIDKLLYTLQKRFK